MKINQHFSVFSMPLIAMLFSGCAGLTPDFYKTVDNIATDDCIKVSVDRDAFKKDTDVTINIEVRNKDISS